jgi:endonuclease III
MAIPAEIAALAERLNQNLTEIEQEAIQGISMTQSSLTEEQQAKLAEIVEAARLAEQKAREMSELATAITQKYQRRLQVYQQIATEEQGN